MTRSPRPLITRLWVEQTTVQLQCQTNTLAEEEPPMFIEVTTIQSLLVYTAVVFDASRS